MSTDDHELAGRLAVAAGRELADLRGQSCWASGKGLGQLGDERSHELLVSGLLAECPGDAVVSEHGTAGVARGAGVRTWIVDPLDGTREFSEPDRSDWAVHVALARDGNLLAGAVALPACGSVLSTAEPPVIPESEGRLRVVVSRSRPPEFIPRLVKNLSAETVPSGSAGAKIAAVVLGDVSMSSGRLPHDHVLVPNAQNGRSGVGSHPRPARGRRRIRAPRLAVFRRQGLRGAAGGGSEGVLARSDSIPGVARRSTRGTG